MPVKILICDDNINIINHINNNLIDYAKQKELCIEIDTFTNSQEASLSNTAYDIAFVDVEVPEIGGLRLASILKEKNKNIIIFVITSYESYLDDAMDIGVFRYITKPIDDARFFRGFDSALKRYQKSTQLITVEYYDEIYSIFTDDIVYITIEDRKAVIVTKSNKYSTNKRLSYWKEKLNSFSYFVQPHHSYIINLNYVSTFNKTDVVLEYGSDKITLPISQRGYSGFKKAYFLYAGV